LHKPYEISVKIAKSELPPNQDNEKGLKHMRLAVLSDIHGNLEAFKEVLTDIGHSQVDAVACLGDNIGYGPYPEEVIHLVRQYNIPCVMGNHELAVVDPSYLAWFNPEAQRSILLTERLLSPDSTTYIHALKASMVIEGCLCVHGCPPDSITIYIFEPSKGELRQLFKEMEQRICFVGHTHDLEIFRFDGEDVSRTFLQEGVIQLRKDEKYIINAGSVGQPRDSNNNAKYVIWDDALDTLEVKFVPYNIAVTASKIIELGFPQFNAIRLW
jgi:predicted phosphodiesterase